MSGAERVIVETKAGRVSGVQAERHQYFRGIPYARPPVAARRFRAPEAARPWDDVLDASRFGPSAAQNKSLLPGMEPGPQGDDCLSLNVYTPAADAGSRPVMFWIHGGAFTGGSSAQQLYEGTALCTRSGAVVVTINYRLGAFGYLHHDGKDANAGQLDQILALEWVRDNIERFGGDPDNVMIFGESAGGMAVTTLLAMPRARGLFHKAVPQSGAAHHTLDPDGATRVAENLLAAAGVDTADALRSLPSETILKAQVAAIEETRKQSLTEGGDGGGLAFAPAIDGASLPLHPLDAIGQGMAADVPLLVGSNTDENKLFTLGNIDQIDEDMLGRRVSRIAGRDHSSRIIDTYRRAREARGAAVHPGELLDAIQSDQGFRLPAIRLLETQLDHSPKAWSYLFAWTSPARDGMLGACHALELPFMWGTLKTAPTMDRFAGSGPDADALSEAMMDAWSAFARTGDPGCEALPDWAPYDLERRPTLVFDRETRIEHAPLDDEREAWHGLL
jgi:para-nitrobenzyl esterase